jgi:hypothetical protein
MPSPWCGRSQVSILILPYIRMRHRCAFSCYDSYIVSILILPYIRLRRVLPSNSVVFIPHPSLHQDATHPGCGRVKQLFGKTEFQSSSFPTSGCDTCTSGPVWYFGQPVFQSSSFPTSGCDSGVLLAGLEAMRAVSILILPYIRMRHGQAEQDADPVQFQSSSFPTSGCDVASRRA